MIVNYYKNDGSLCDLTDCDYVQIKLNGNHATIKDSNILVSKSSLELVLSFEWYLGKDGYPVAYKCLDDKNIKLGKGIKLHKLLKGHECPKGMVIDHINHDKLDNRLTNLRICTPKENSYNTSKKINKNGKYKGVTHNKSGYIATINKNGIKHQIKNISTEKEAAEIYDMMAENLFGIYAGKNFNYK